MRLLQLTLDADQDDVFELHPMLTVVRGLDERDRQRLIRVVSAIANGEDPGCPGLVEAHGVVMDLTADSLAMLDTGVDIDPLVRRRELPGAVASLYDEDPAVEADEVGSLDPAEAFLAAAPKGVYPDLDRVRRRRRDTREAVAVLRFAAEQAARDLEVARRERQVAVERLDAASALAAAPPGPEHRSGPAALEVAALEAELDTIDAGIIELEGIDDRPIAVLLDAIQNPSPIENVPSPRAQELADRFVGVQQQIVALEDRMEAEGRGPVSALRRLDEARAEVLAAERALQRAEVLPEDEEALTAAHDLVLEAERKASGLRSRSGQRKLAEALAAQQEILDRIGYPTWSAYIMGASVMGTDPAAQVRLDVARDEERLAEEAWVEITTAMEADEEHQRLLDQLEQVEIEAVRLLIERAAPVPDERDGLEPALRDLRESRSDVTPEQLIEALAFHLETIGLDLGERVEPSHVVLVAQAFLDEAEGIALRVDELTTERRRLEARLADARSRAEAEAWEALEASVDGPAPEPEPTLADLDLDLAEAHDAERELAEILDAREALLETALVADRRAEEQAVAVAEEILAAAAGDVGDLLASLDGGAEGAAFTSRPGWSEIDAEAIEFYLLARLAAQRQVSYAGSVPLVIDDALAGVPEEDVRRVLEGLGRMAESVQIVYLTDDPVIVEWAEQRPGDAAVVGRVPSPAESTV
jgi:hypothetical protein